MAKAANRSSVTQAHEGPDYAGAVAIIQGRIANAKIAQSEASGKASKAWQEIEKMGLHRAGAQAAAKVMGISDEDDRNDYLRTLSKVLEAAGIGIPVDLADQAEGVTNRPVVPRVKGGSSKKPPEPEAPPPGPPGDTDLAGEHAAPDEPEQPSGEAEPPIERQRRSKTVSFGEAKRRVQAHFSEDGATAH